MTGQSFASREPLVNTYFRLRRIFFRAYHVRMKHRSDKPSYRELRDLGIASGYASDLAAGKRLPSLSLAQRIEAVLGYPASAWRLEERAA